MRLCTCRRCSHGWYPRKPTEPITCPKCKSIYWKVNRKVCRKARTRSKTRAPQPPEYRSWAGMIQRCTNRKNPMYSYYGGRGIKVCDEWRNSYQRFLADMGRRASKKHTLDRIDNELGYFKENCRWSTRETQARNRKSVKLNEALVIEIRKLAKEGETQKSISELYGVSLNLIHKVVRHITWKNI